MDNPANFDRKKRHTIIASATLVVLQMFQASEK